MRKFLSLLIIIPFLIGVNPEKIGEKIRIANLMMGLELTPQQIDFLKKAQREILLRRDALENSPEVQERRRLLKEIYSQLRKEGRISSEIAEEYHRVNARFKRQVDEILEFARERAKEFLVLLQPHQRKALEEYVPCIIPPETGSRIGQAETNPHLVKALERVRRIPTFRWIRIREDIADRIASREPGYALMEDKEREARKREILSILERARDLNEVDFMVEREKLAGELKPGDKRKNAVGVVMKFLLSPSASTVLDELNLEANTTRK